MVFSLTTPTIFSHTALSTEATAAVSAELAPPVESAVDVAPALAPPSEASAVVVVLAASGCVDDVVVLAADADGFVAVIARLLVAAAAARLRLSPRLVVVVVLASKSAVVAMVAPSPWRDLPVAEALREAPSEERPVWNMAVSAKGLLLLLLMLSLVAAVALGMPAPPAVLSTCTLSSWTTTAGAREETLSWSCHMGGKGAVLTLKKTRPSSMRLPCTVPSLR